jgi:hypothetical protein
MITELKDGAANTNATFPTHSSGVQLAPVLVIVLVGSPETNALMTPVKR